MSPRGAYATTGRFAEHGPVTVDRALDPVTGLDVLVYRFPGEPVAGAEGLDPASFWAVLETGADEEGGFVVTNVHDGAASLRDRPAALDDRTAARIMAAVAAAAGAGVPHGDLGAHRVFVRGGSAWLEGYGVPWGAATPPDDARRLARELLDLEGTALGDAARAELERVADAGDASRAAAALRALARPAPERPDTGAGSAPVAEPTDSPADLELGPTPVRPRLPRNAASAAFDQVRLDPHASSPGSPPASTAGSGEHEPGAGLEAGDRPGAVTADRRQGVRPRAPGGAALPPSVDLPGGRRGARTGAPGRTAPRSTARPTFSKEPPPDVRYRSAEEQPHDEERGVYDELGDSTPRGDRRRVLLLAGLVAAAMVLALLILFGGGGRGAAEAVAGAPGAYVVDIAVVPERHPPVSLVVVSSPAGSAHAPGTVLGSVPKRVVLDREGTWQLQGRFQDRRSDVVTIQVPRDGSATVAFAEAAR